MAGRFFTLLATREAHLAGGLVLYEDLPDKELWNPESVRFSLQPMLVLIRITHV